MPYFPPASASGYSTLQDEGVAQTQRTTADFVGAGVTVTDTGAKTQISIPGGAGGDLALNLLAPAVDETVTAGYSCTVERNFKIASGKKLTIGSGSRFRIH